MKRPTKTFRSEIRLLTLTLGTLAFVLGAGSLVSPTADVGVTPAHAAPKYGPAGPPASGRRRSYCHRKFLSCRAKSFDRCAVLSRRRGHLFNGRFTDCFDTQTGNCDIDYGTAGNCLTRRIGL